MDEMEGTEIDALKAEEKEKLRAAGSGNGSALKKKSSPGEPVRRHLGWVLILVGVMLLLAMANGTPIWRWWWLIFLVIPIVSGGVCGWKHRC